MEAIAEQPAQPKVYPINSSNASELAKKRWQKERDAKDAVKQAVSKALAEVQNTPKPEVSIHARAIAKLEGQLEAIDNDLEKASGDPDAWHKLTTSRSKLFEQWRILSGIAMPGSLKPMQPKQNRNKHSDLPQPE